MNAAVPFIDDLSRAFEEGGMDRGPTGGRDGGGTSRTQPDAF